MKSAFARFALGLVSSLLAVNSGIFQAPEAHALQVSSGGSCLILFGGSRNTPEAQRSTLGTQGQVRTETMSNTLAKIQTMVAPQAQYSPPGAEPVGNKLFVPKVVEAIPALRNRNSPEAKRIIEAIEAAHAYGHGQVGRQAGTQASVGNYRVAQLLVKAKILKRYGNLDKDQVRLLMKLGIVGESATTPLPMPKLTILDRILEVLFPSRKTNRIEAMKKLDEAWKADMARATKEKREALLKQGLDFIQSLGLSKTYSGYGGLAANYGDAQTLDNMLANPDFTEPEFFKRVLVQIGRGTSFVQTLVTQGSRMEPAIEMARESFGGLPAMQQVTSEERETLLKDFDNSVVAVRKYIVESNASNQLKLSIYKILNQEYAPELGSQGPAIREELFGIMKQLNEDARAQGEAAKLKDLKDQRFRKDNTTAVNGDAIAGIAVSYYTQRPDLMSPETRAAFEVATAKKGR